MSQLRNRQNFLFPADPHRMEQLRVFIRFKIPQEGFSVESSSIVSNNVNYGCNNANENTCFFLFSR